MLFAILTAVDLSKCMGVLGCGCPISLSVSHNIVACLQLRKRVPSSASTADAMMNLKIAHSVKNVPFHLMGPVGSGFHPMVKCRQTLLWAFALDRYNASKWMLSIMSDA